MKMIKYIIIAMSFIAINSACKKSELDLGPFNQIETTQAFNTENDANLALNGMYFGLRASGSYYMGSWNIVGEVTSDNVIISVGGRQSQVVFSNWQYTGDNTLGLFGGGYTMIRRANAIIENIDKVQGSSPAFINGTKGQALAVRAMVHFDMARVYGRTPLTITASDNKTIPYVTSTDPTIKPSNELVVDVYDKIIADLNAAVPLLTTTYTSGRLNRAAVDAVIQFAQSPLYKNARDNNAFAAAQPACIADGFCGYTLPQKEPPVYFKNLCNAKK